MKTDTSAINIPTFELYGEQSQRQQAEFIHIEDISSRSKQHDWLIKPHRHGKLFQLLILFDGAAEVWLNEQTLALNGNWAISIPPGHVHGFRFPADTQGMVLTVMDSLLSDSQDSLVNNHFDGLLNAPHTIRFEEKQLLFTQLKHYLHLLQGEFQNAGYSQAGKIGPAYCTGVGKAMLAYLDAAELGHVINQQSFHRFTDATLSGPETLRAELGDIRANGYGFDREEHEPGIICVALPILSLSGRVLGALSVTSSTERTNLAALEALVPRISATASAISQDVESWRFPDQARENLQG